MIYINNRMNKTIAFLFALLLGTTCLKAQTYKPEFDKLLLGAKQGTIVELPGFLSEKLPEIPYEKMVLPGPQFIISDDPEYIRVPEGISLRENVQPGSVRLYMYNVNGVKEPQKMDRKITALIRNTGKSVLHMRMLKYSSQKPSGNYFQIGKQGLADYFASNGDEKIREIKPGQALPVDEKMEKNVVKYDELAHGFYEFTVDQPAEITILQTDPATPGVKALERVTNILPPKGESGAGRGVYGVSNYLLRNRGFFDTQNGPAAITVAEGVKDNWVLGWESSRNQQAKLVGNYGVMYHMEIKWKSTNGKGLALVTWNGRSADSKWCNGMAATMVVSKGTFKEGIIQLPSDRLITRSAPESILIQVFPPAANGEEQTLKLTYSPPGASCLPTPLIFIPVDMK